MCCRRMDLSQGWICGVLRAAVAQCGVGWVVGHWQPRSRWRMGVCWWPGDIAGWVVTDRLAWPLFLNAVVGGDGGGGGGGLLG